MQKLLNTAGKVRREIIEHCYRTKSPHIGSCFSMVELLVFLYFKQLKVFPRRPMDKHRDRFILSKGHACLALYIVLAYKGFIPKDDLKNYCVNGSYLKHHPDMDIAKGIELSSGSLGHGLSVGVGMALAARKDGAKHKVYVLLSDGELNEGSTWEAIMFAAHHKLNNLVAVVDYNKMQALGFTKDTIDIDPLAQKWSSFGWDVREVDGHNFDEISKGFDLISVNAHKPSVIIAHTIKGKGIAFMENNILWHYRSPDDAEYQIIMKELAH